MTTKGPTKYKIVNKEIERQQGQWGYNMGKRRRAKIKKNPAKGGSPKDDGYGQMTPLEKKGYKKGYRGD